MYYNTAQSCEFVIPPIVYEDISNTYIYGVHSDGSCIGRARLSNQRLNAMRRSTKISQLVRVARLAQAKNAAIDGFELLMQITEYEDAVQNHLPLVVDAWTNYFAYTVQFSLISDAFFNVGIHLLLIGGHTDSGSFLIRSKVVPHVGALSDLNLKLIASKRF